MVFPAYKPTSDKTQLMNFITAQLITSQEEGLAPAAALRFNNQP